VRILGIDPGLRITGYACIVPGPRPSIVEAGVFRLVKGTATSDAGSVSARLEELDRDFRELLLAIRQAGLRLIELKPAQVKKSCVGFGGASKGAMQRAMQREFALAELPTPPDLADALGIALCAATRMQLGESIDLPAAARRKGTRRRAKSLPAGVRALP
jgi:crossover junction endodeoxyribonuclease RuvC